MFSAISQWPKLSIATVICFHCPWISTVYISFVIPSKYFPELGVLHLYRLSAITNKFWSIYKITCMPHWVVNVYISLNYFLFAAQCKVNADCPYDKACINEHCLNPCASTSCGRNAECTVQTHIAQCRCPPGTQGNPQISCIAGVCQYNEDCADHEACDRLNRVCRPVCEEDTCATTATCVGRQHQPKCTCPPGTTGNPFQECTGKKS